MAYFFSLLRLRTVKSGGKRVSESVKNRERSVFLCRIRSWVICLGMIAFCSFGVLNCFDAVQGEESSGSSWTRNNGAPAQNNVPAQNNIPTKNNIPAQGSSIRIYDPDPKNVPTRVESPIRKPEKLQTVEIIENTADKNSPIFSLSDVSEQKEIEKIIDEGRKLYLEENWPAFRQHFEKASRRFPKNALIQSSYIKARCCIELAGRYKDSSFLDLVNHCDEKSVAALYDEVFANVQTWHVDTPDWKSLLDHGIDGLEIAFSTPVFLNYYKINSEISAVLRTYCSVLRDFNNKNTVQTSQELRNRIFEIAKQISSKTPVSENAVTLEFICSMTCSLDPWSSFLTPSQINDLYSMIDGNFVGLGIELKPDNTSLLIVRVIPGSPAETAGLTIGDHILSINGTLIEDPKDNDATSRLLQGKEGSVAELQVIDAANKIRHVNVIRKRVDVPSVENVHMITVEPNQERVGYLKISCFQKTTDKELVSALHELDRQGMQCLIIDLRQNPGGLLREAIDISDMFLESGTIVKTKGRSGEKPYFATGNKAWSVPLLILIDGNSASASEIFAGAMHENGRARVIGTRSYGKGTVQALLRLKGESANFVSVSGLRLTTEKFYSPLGNPYSGIGVEPDVVIQEEADKTSEGNSIFKNVSQSSETRKDFYGNGKTEDPCLERAVQEARHMLLSAGSGFGGGYSFRRK